LAARLLPVQAAGRDAEAAFECLRALGLNVEAEALGAFMEIATERGEARLVANAPGYADKTARSPPTAELALAIA
jgi:hypothetical protein